MRARILLAAVAAALYLAACAPSAWAGAWSASGGRRYVGNTALLFAGYRVGG